MTLFRTLFSVLLCLFCTACTAAEWTEDFDAAKATAAKENKDLLLDFTGSDWCQWCIKLKQEVLGQDGFISEASKNFVLVELDYPRGKQQDAAIKARNKELATKFSIEGFPTVILMDAKGQAYGRTGYRPGGVQKYLEHINKVKSARVERDKLFEEADKATGLDRAVLLDKALDAMNKFGNLVGYDDKIKEIQTLDSDNKKGLKGKYYSYTLLENVQKKLQGKDPDGALKEVTDYLKDYTPTGTVKQQVYFMKAVALNYKNDNDGALAALQIAHDADPDSEHGDDIAKIISRLKEQSAAAPKK